jgi:hypothetical protein
MNLSPIRFGMTPMALLGAGRREQRRLQRAVGHLRRQGPAQPSTGQSLQGQPDRRRRDADSAGNLVEPDPGVLKRSTSRTWRIVVLSAGIRRQAAMPVRGEAAVNHDVCGGLGT